MIFGRTKRDAYGAPNPDGTKGERSMGRGVLSDLLNSEFEKVLKLGIWSQELSLEELGTHQIPQHVTLPLCHNTTCTICTVCVGFYTSKYHFSFHVCRFFLVCLIFLYIPFLPLPFINFFGREGGGCDLLMLVE